MDHLKEGVASSNWSSLQHPLTPSPPPASLLSLSAAWGGLQRAGGEMTAPLTPHQPREEQGSSSSSFPADSTWGSSQISNKGVQEHRWAAQQGGVAAKALSPPGDRRQHGHVRRGAEGPAASHHRALRAADPRHQGAHDCVHEGGALRLCLAR